MDEEIITALKTDALAFLERAETASRNTATDLSCFCDSLRDLIESELAVSDESPADLFTEVYDYYARV